MDPIAQFDDVIDVLHPVVAGISRDQLTLSTPCAKWTVGDLLAHIVGGGHAFAAAFRGTPAEMEAPRPAELLGDDHVKAIEGAIEDFNRAIAEPGALDRQVTLPFATLPGTAVVQLASFDLMVHAWDLARATGQTLTPPDALVDYADGIGRGFVQGPLRDGDTFADEVAPPAGASPVDRLAAFAGRQP